MKKKYLDEILDRHTRTPKKVLGRQKIRSIREIVDKGDF